MFCKLHGNDSFCLSLSATIIPSRYVLSLVIDAGTCILFQPAVLYDVIFSQYVILCTSRVLYVGVDTIHKKCPAHFIARNLRSIHAPLLKRYLRNVSAHCIELHQNSYSADTLIDELYRMSQVEMCWYQQGQKTFKFRVCTRKHIWR